MTAPVEAERSRGGKYRRLAGNIGFFLITAVATRLITFIMIPLYTSYLTQGEYGLTELALTTIELVYPVLTLMIGEAVLRFSIEDRGNSRAYITSGFWVTLLGCVVVITLVPALHLPLFGGLGQYGWYFVAAYGASLLQMYFGNIAKILNQMAFLTTVSVVSSVVTAGLAMIFVAFAGWGVEGYFLSYIGGNAVAVLAFLVVGGYWRQIGWPELSVTTRTRLGHMFRYSAPLIPNSLSWWLLSNVNRYVITIILGVSATGLYSAASKIPNFLSLIAGVFYYAWTLSAFQEYQRSDVKGFFGTTFKLYQAGLAIGCGALILLGQWIAGFLLQNQFYTAWTIIPTLLIAFYLNTLAMFFSSVYTTVMKTRAAAITTMAGAIVTVLLSVPFVHALGLEGAALSVAAGTLTLLIYRVWDTRRLLNFGASIPVLVVTSILLATIAALTTMQFPWHHAWAAGLFIVVVAVHGWHVLPVIKGGVARVRGGQAKMAGDGQHWEEH